MRKISVRDNNGRCLIRFTHEGVPYSLNLGNYNDPKDRINAERIALEIYERIQTGTFDGIDDWKQKKVILTKKGIIELLEERKEENSFFPPLLNHLYNYDEDFRGKRGAKKFIESLPISTITKRRYYSAFRTIEELRELFTFEIKAKKDERKKEIDPFTVEEVEKIKEAMKGNHYEDFFYFLLHTGCRTSEGIGIQWEKVEFENSRIRFDSSLARVQGNRNLRVRKTTKNGKIRYTPLSDELREILSKRPKTGDLIFYAPEGGNVSDKEFRRRPWKNVLKAAGVRYRSPYNLRHTFISHCLRKGVDVVTVAYWVGNSPEVIYKHYAGMIDAVPLPKLF